MNVKKAENKPLVNSGYRDGKRTRTFGISSVHVFRHASETCSSNVRVGIQSVKVVSQPSERVEFLWHIIGITRRGVLSVVFEAVQILVSFAAHVASVRLFFLHANGSGIRD